MSKIIKDYDDYYMLFDIENVEMKISIVDKENGKFSLAFSKNEEEIGFEEYDTFLNFKNPKKAINIIIENIEYVIINVYQSIKELLKNTIKKLKLLGLVNI